MVSAVSPLAVSQYLEAIEAVEAVLVIIMTYRWWLPGWISRAEV